MQKKYQHTVRSKNSFLALLAAPLLFLGLLLGVTLPLSFSDAAHAATSVDKLKTGEVSLTKQQAERAGLNPVSDDKLVKTTLNGVYSLLAIVAVIVVIIAGYSMMTADGDSQKVATARKTIIYACVGLVIVASAFIITGIVQGIATK